MTRSVGYAVRVQPAENAIGGGRGPLRPESGIAPGRKREDIAAAIDS